MGGRLWVESMHGAGRTFHFTIRAGMVSVTSARPEPAKMAMKLVSRRILLAEDNEDNQGLAIALLERDGRDPRARADDRHARADHRDDCACASGRSRAMPCRGHDAYVPKPIRHHELRMVLASVFPAHVIAS